ncbi:hypothetical protein CDL12_09305 [Handroanthus impetiginosus]|uniref:Uncharacterized protein n=1 Tax=Handroanthus impetiginosus TaxID=429701 RepID=A0A2G9HKK1_9LAMI|nr:hypothetical protein CDL12_09305 [Handroanthus impetiginosus]
MWLLRLVFFLGLGLGFDFADALKVPFRVKDVLPVLPHQISWPVLNNINSAFDLLPQYIGSLTPNNGTINWKGACFLENEAKIDFTVVGDRGVGGGIISLTVCDLDSMCIYVVVCVYSCM